MMKKLTLVLALTAFIFSAMNAQVIFDPAIFPPENLPADKGMSIVDIDGTKYLKCPLAGWGTSIVLDKVVVVQPGHTTATIQVKYKEGDATTDWAMEDVNTFLKLAKNDWSDLAKVGAASSAEFADYVISDIPAGDTVKALQWAGQETTTWSAINEDTLFIGKVVIVDPMTLLDPVTTHVDYLPDGWTLDTISDVIYYKVVLNAWSSSFEFNKTNGETVVPENLSSVKAMAKYSVGTGGEVLESINTFLKFSNSSWGEIAKLGAASNTEFTKYALDMIPDTTLGVFQVAGQSTNSWSALVGDTLWVGAWYPNYIETVTVTADGDATGIDEKGGTLQLSAAVAPDDVFNDSVTWSSSDDGIATVDDYGLVTAMDDGDVTITATATDGSEVAGTIDLNMSNQNVAVSNTSVSKLKMYPNPVEDMLYIQNADMGSSLEIYNIGGQLVKSVNNLDSNTSIDVSELSDGIYVVRAYQDREVKTMKLVK